MNEFDLLTFLSSQNITFIDKGHFVRVKCLNPNHNDTNPSMGISKSYPHLFHCFSCQYSGNVFTLVKTLTGKSFYEYIGTDAKSFQFLNHLPSQSFKTVKHYSEVIIKGDMLEPYRNDQVMSYLYSRNINQKFINHFNITYMIKGEINGTRIYNRLLIPIYENSKLVNVECRDFTYKSNKKVLYPRGCKSDLVFNLDRLDKDKPMFLTEGIMDLPNLFNLGLTNIGSIFGTGLTRNQIEFLRSIKNIVYIPDNDEPGIKVLDLLEEHMQEEFYIAFIPKHRKDPGDCTISEIKAAIENKISSQDYLLNKLELFKVHHISW